MRKPGYAIFLIALFVAFSCDNNHDALEESLPEFHILTTQVNPEDGGIIQPESGEYLAGDSLEVEAIAAEGYVFEHWEGSLSGNTNPDMIYLNSNSTVTAHFSLKDYNLNIDIEGSGTVREVVVERSSAVTVRLEAEAEDGWNFDRWEGDLSGNSNPETITLEEDEEKNVTAIFEQDPEEEYSLTIETEGEGVVDVDPDKDSYTDGEEVTLTAEPDTGWSFKEWQGDISGSDNPSTITLDEDKEVTAIFEQDDDSEEEYSLTIETEGEGVVDIDPDKDSYTEGEEVTLTAEAASGWSFVEWQGDISGSDNPSTIALDEDKEVTAIFEQDDDSEEEYSLTIETDGEGSVDIDPDKDSYTEGEEVTLTAEAASGWSFVEWQGDASGNSNPVSITLDEDKEVTAVFEEDPPEEYSLTINTDGEGSVDINPDKDSYTEGEEVTLTAEAASGWSFVEWQGDISGSTNPETITIDANMQITAIFEADAEAGINILDVRLFVEKMELEGARQTSDFETENFILNLPLDGSAFNITHVTIPAGYYSELELEIEKPDNSVNVSDSDFRDGAGSYSLAVNGTFNEADFTFQSTKDFEIELKFAPHLEIESGQTSVIAIDIDFENWFTRDDDELLDPNDSGNTDEINKNIEDSFKDFEDNFKPGRGPNLAF